MDELDQLGIKASFFCVGKLARDFPSIVKTIADKTLEELEKEDAV